MTAQGGATPIYGRRNTRPEGATGGPPGAMGNWSYWTPGSDVGGGAIADPLVPCAVPAPPAAPVLTGIAILAWNALPSNRAKNEQSIVLRVQYGNVVVILTGDATRSTESKILETYELRAPFLQATHLLAAHHGSTSGSVKSPSWVPAVNPNVLLFSAGGFGHYGHPRCDVTRYFFTERPDAPRIGAGGGLQGGWGWWPPHYVGCYDAPQPLFTWYMTIPELWQVPAAPPPLPGATNYALASTCSNGHVVIASDTGAVPSNDVFQLVGSNASIVYNGRPCVQPTGVFPPPPSREPADFGRQ